MKEEWLMPGAIVPVNPDTTKALVDEIKRLIDVVGGLVLKQGPDYERGFIDGMQKQAQSSVDKAVNAMSKREWVGLTDDEIEKGRDQTFSINNPYCPCDSKTMRKAVRWAEAKLKEKNT
jgi:hypothetical protein